VASAISHPVVALALAPAFGAPRAAVAAGALLSVLPDADAIGFWVGVPYGAPLGHRGLTHSLAFAALLAAIALAIVRRISPAAAAGRVRSLFLFLFLCAASHGVLDAFTDGGLGVAFFAPFSNERHFFPWTPILVSPISVSGFFDARGLRVLASELVWIWLPCAAIAAATWVRRRPAGGAAQDPPATGA
jgi:inner membrane protein